MKKSLKKDRCIRFIQKFCGRNVFVFVFATSFEHFYKF